jgi:hypothetical protein
MNAMKFLLGLLLLFGVVQAQTITVKNWRSDPRILEVRAIYVTVNTLVAKKLLKLEQQKFGYCPSWDLERSKFTAANGVVRRYIKAGGSEDSAVTFEHTYDARGRLRFVLVKAGAVNDTHLELRFYFDSAGKRVWLDRRQTGPGYTFADADFVREMVWQPEKAFVAAPPC